MLNRKLEAAVLTVILGFFVMPLVFTTWQSDYFTIGLVISMYAAPFVFLGGIPISSFIQKRASRPLAAAVGHGVAGLIMSAVFGIVTQAPLDVWTLALVSGVSYSLLFFGVDYFLTFLKLYKDNSQLAKSER